MAFYPLQVQPYFLAGSGVIIGDTSITLKSMKTIDGASLTMSTDFGTKGYATLEPGNNTLEESISFTGLTNNANGTTTLTGVSNVTFETPYTETSGLSKTHAGSTTLIISNTSGYYTEFGIKENNEVLTGQWSAPDPVGSTDIANKQWVLSVVNGGPISIDSVVLTGTAGETLAAGNFVYLKVADGRWWKTSAASSATTDFIQIGIAQGSGTAGSNIAGGVLVEGVDTHQTGLATGTTYYLQDTAGTIGSSTGTVSRAIGQGLTSTSILFDPYFKAAITDLEQTAVSTLTTAGTIGTGPFVRVSFGDGSDGAVTIAAPTTLSRDMFYTSLIVNSTLNTAGWKIYVQGQISGTGNIVAPQGGNGGTGTTSTSGAAASAGGIAGIIGTTTGYLKGVGGVVGGAGIRTGVGAAGGAGVNGNIGGNSVSGGAGGAGNIGVSSGGAAGASASFVQNIQFSKQTQNTFDVVDINSTGFVVIRKPASGGAGGAGGSNNSDTFAGGGGGGSGASGGIIYIAASTWAGTFTITSVGGNGGSGGSGGLGSGAGCGGGGAGGNGGTSIVIYRTKTWTGTYALTAGSAGAGGTTTGAGSNGSAGTAGAAGTSYEIVAPILIV